MLVVITDRENAYVEETPASERRGSNSGYAEARESVKTIKCGNLELVESAEQVVFC